MWTLRCIPDPSSLLLLLWGPFKKVGFSSYHQQKIIWFFNSRVWKLLWKADTDSHKGRLPNESEILTSVVLSVIGKLKTLVFLAIVHTSLSGVSFIRIFLFPQSIMATGGDKFSPLSTPGQVILLNTCILKTKTNWSGQVWLSTITLRFIASLLLTSPDTSTPGPDQVFLKSYATSGQGDNLFWLRGNNEQFFF